MEAITKIHNEYRARKIFRVTHIEDYNAFECIRRNLEDDPFQICLPPEMQINMFQR